MRLKFQGTKLFSGNLEDCGLCSTASQPWSILHCCPECHEAKLGVVAPEQPNHLWFAEEQGAWLNLDSAPQVDPIRNAIRWVGKEMEAGRNILAHSIDGHSRGPALCLLALAKHRFAITNESFDAARVEFEKLAGEPFCPTDTMEAFLREQWEALNVVDRRRVQQTRIEVPDGLRPEQLSRMSPLELRAIIEAQPLIHFAAFTEIQNKKRQWVRPIPNQLQRDIAEAYDWCMRMGIPCRLIILKPRQVGCSTFVGELCYHHMRRFRSKMLIMSDTTKRALTVWEMFRNIQSHDDYSWNSHITKDNLETIEVTFPDSEKGSVRHDTAMDAKAGTSDTIQIGWWTEVARYLKVDGRDKKVMMTSLISLANEPNTVGIVESTAEGSAGFFFETWHGAVSLADRKAHKKDPDGHLIVGNGWIKIFAPWHAFDGHQLRNTPENQQYFKPELDLEEARGVDIYGWNEAQLAWRRFTLALACQGDVRNLHQDFPSDPDECFLASGRQRFNQKGLIAMEKAAMENHHKAWKGTLAMRGDEVVPRKEDESDEYPWLWVDEEPKPGYSYIGFLDPMTGEQSKGSQFADAHAVGIFRAGRHEKNVYIPPKLVAVIDVENGCRWDDEVLAPRIAMLLKYYGDCMIVPETGGNLNILGELKKLGLLIYEREVMDALYDGRKTKIAGWQTNTKTRPFLVSAVANYVREYSTDNPSITINYLPMIRQLQNFIVNEDGKSEARFGTHDDFVLGPGLALYNLELAQPMPFPASPFGDSGYQPPRMPGGLNGGAFS